jgi:hypothetical protein
MVEVPWTRQEGLLWGPGGSGFAELQRSTLSHPMKMIRALFQVEEMSSDYLRTSTNLVSRGATIQGPSRVEVRGRVGRLRDRVES